MRVTAVSQGSFKNTIIINQPPHNPSKFKQLAETVASTVQLACSNNRPPPSLGWL